MLLTDIRSRGSFSRRSRSRPKNSAVEIIRSTQHVCGARGNIWEHVGGLRVPASPRVRVGTMQPCVLGAHNRSNTSWNTAPITPLVAEGIACTSTMTTLPRTTCPASSAVVER